MAFTVNNQEKICVGVIGAGTMGAYHLQKLSALSGVRLLGFYDPDVSRPNGESSAGNYVRYTSLDDLLFEADAVVVASPTKTHFSNVQRALRAGAHVLVEKPFCGDLELAKRLVDLAESSRLILQVGFVERHRFHGFFSPLDTKLVYGSVQRHSRTLNREPNIGVVWDLMIHDIDIALSFASCEPELVDADGGIVVTQELDYARCRLGFPNGLVFDCFASRVARENVRVFFGQTHSQSFRVDFLMEAHNSGADPLQEQAKYFLKGIEQGRIDDFSGRRTLPVLATIERIHSAILQQNGQKNGQRKDQKSLNPISIDSEPGF